MTTLQQPLLTFKFSSGRFLSFSGKTVLGLIILVGALLRLLALGRWSLWIDELYNLSLMPVSTGLARGIPADQHPPLYYLLLEAVLQLGRQEWLMRLPSALAGILTIPMMWLVGRALKRPKLGLLAAALLALAPLHVWYSREARMYALAMLFWSAAIYFYIQVLRRDNWLDSLGLALTMSAGLYTAYPTMALWIGQVAFFFLFWHLNGRKRGRLLRWLSAQAVTGLLFAGWWPFMRIQLERSLVFNWLNLLEPLFGQATAEQLNQILEQNGITTTLAGTLQLALLGGLAFIIFATLLSWLLVRRPSTLKRIRRLEAGPAMLVILLLLLVTIAGAVPRGLSLRRQLLVFWLPFLVPAAWALLRLKQRWLVAAVLGLSLLLSITTSFGPPYADWRDTVAVISENGRPGDLILVSPTWSKLAFDYYYQGDLPYEGTTPQQAQRQRNKLEAAGRVWLVVNRHPTIAGQIQNTEQWFANNSRLVQTYHFPQYLTVYELKVDPN